MSMRLCNPMFLLWDVGETFKLIQDGGYDKSMVSAAVPLSHNATLNRPPI